MTSWYIQTSWWRHVLIAAWAALFAAPLARSGDESNRSRFLEEYQPHVDVIQKRYNNIFVDFISTSPAGDKQQVQHVTGKFNRWSYLLRGKSKWIQKDTGKVLSESSEVVECRNALYSFVLRPGQGEDYALSDLKIHDATHETVFCFLSAPYANWEERKTYLEIAQDPKTRIIAFADRVWQGKPMKVVECQYTIIHRGTHKPVEVTRAFYFDPNEGWICCGLYAGQSPKTKEYLEEIYLYESVQGERLPKLKRTERWIRDSQNPRDEKLLNATDISEFRRSPKPFDDSDFRLSAFGLPEPMGVKQPEPPRTWLWLIAGAIGAGLLAILFARLKRRRASTKPAAP